MSTGSSVRTIAIILLGAILVFTGNGLLQTMLPMRADLEHFSTAMIGLQGTAYFGGFIAGCVLGPGLIKNVGHIRAFAGVVAILAAVILVFAIWIDPYVWIGLRLMTGACLAVTVMSLESWLNDQATNENRGRMLSIYFIVSNAGWIAGQLAVNLSSLQGSTLFILVTVMVCLSVAPVVLTPTKEPTPVPDARLDLRGLFALSLVGTIGCFLVGAAEGAFWTLGPVFGQQRGMSVFEVTLLMGSFVLGGTLSQWPIGRLSDNHDRRIVILPVTLATVATGLTIAFTGELDLKAMLALAVLHGALMIPIYSLCIAHVNDSAPSDRFVQVSGGLLLIYSAGAALGPLAAAPLMDHYGPGGLFMFLSAVLALFGVVVIFRIIVARRRIRAFPDRYALVTRTTQSIYEMEEH
ncbi:MAG: MFS transporter [Hyphomicrobiales bacterium]|nr:MAG: MFS transporter [Hyphomicrobiales bacterium]